MNINPSHPKFHSVLRTTIVVGMLFFASEVVHLHATSFEYLSSEGTIIEQCQNVLLGLMLVISILAARYQTTYRVFFVACSTLATIMLIREQNNWFKIEMFRGAWELAVVIVLIPAGGWLFKRRKQFVDQLGALAPLSPSVVGATGLIILLVFSRMMGRKAIWKGVMGNHYSHSLKMVVEESLELLGYSLMLAGLINLIIFIRQMDNAEHTVFADPATDKRKRARLGQ